MKLIGDKAYNTFIDTGKISDRVIQSISLKIMKNIKLDEREAAVFYAKTKEVNERIIKISKL